jgi:superfamily II DNA or RNA helicase
MFRSVPCVTQKGESKIKNITLRPYQQECIDTIQSQPPGNYLVQMATGLGKTVTFANVPRQGRMLIVSHREELVRQPLKYFACQTGIEQGKYRASPWDEVVSASVQSLARRFDRFSPSEFDIIVWDEAHHCAANTYQKIFRYFEPRLNLGFTATPGRGDKVRLDNVFSKIIFSRDLRWGIENNYLSDIYCRRVNIGYDLSAVRMSRGDYAPGELDKAMDGTADAIAEVYRDMAKGATLIFAVSVAHANDIAEKIPGAVVVTGETKDRAAIIQAFTQGKIPVLVNCMVFTEGTDIPRVETVIIARPTQSDSLYTQMVGRGLRLYPGKERLNLIDCVGVSGKASLCTAPTLLGIDLADIPQKRTDDIEGPLFELPEKVKLAADCPQSWIRNVQIVDLWAKGQNYNTHDVNYFKMPDGSLVCSLPDRKRITIPCPNELGQVNLSGEVVSMQTALDRAYQRLCADHEETRYIWDLTMARRWGKAPASDKQINLIERRLQGFDASELTKLEASQILNRIMCGRRAAS